MGVAAVDLWTGVGAAAFGAVAGAVVTAVCTAWVSNRLDQQKELRETSGALTVVRQELSENCQKIGCAEKKPGAIEALRDTSTDGKNDLTLGDWLGSKTAFAGLTRRNNELWRGVAQAYADISDFNRGARERPPSSADLAGLVSRLSTEEVILSNKLGWPRLRQAKGWFTRG